MTFTLRSFSELVLLSAIWGASFLFIKISVPEFGPVVLITLRVAFGAMVLIPFIKWRTDVSIIRKKWFALFILGIANAALPFVLFSYAELFMGAGITSTINASSPIFLALIAVIFLKQSFDYMKFFGMLIGLTGVAVLALNKINFLHNAHILPFLAATLASFMYGVGGIYAKIHLKNIKPLIITVGSQISATVTLLPLCLFFLPHRLPSLGSFLSVMALGVICTGVAFIIYFKILGEVGPQKAITATFLIPLFGMLWSHLFLHESITAHILIGMPMIFLGVILSNRLWFCKIRADTLLENNQKSGAPILKHHK